MDGKRASEPGEGGEVISENPAVEGIALKLSREAYSVQVSRTQLFDAMWEAVGKISPSMFKSDTPHFDIATFQQLLNEGWKVEVWKLPRGKQ